MYVYINVCIYTYIHTHICDIQGAFSKVMASPRAKAEGSFGASKRFEVCMYVCMCVCRCVYQKYSRCVCMCVYVCVNQKYSRCVCKCVCMYDSRYACMHVCMHVGIHTQLQAHTFAQRALNEYTFHIYMCV